jgi:hypothetical protein
VIGTLCLANCDAGTLGEVASADALAYRAPTEGDVVAAFDGFLDFFLQRSLNFVQLELETSSAFELVAGSTVPSAAVAGSRLTWGRCRPARPARGLCCAAHAPVLTFSSRTLSRAGVTSGALPS